MSEPSKKKNTTGPITEFQAAERICRIIAETNGTPLAEEVRLAVEKRRAERRAAANEQIAKLMARVPEGRRGHVGKHILAAGYELNGFEIVAANDATPRVMGDQFRDSDGLPDAMPEAIRNDLAWLDQQVPPVDRIEVDRSTGEARRVGKGRAK